MRMRSVIHSSGRIGRCVGSSLNQPTLGSWADSSSVDRNIKHVPQRNGSVDEFKSRPRRSRSELFLVHLFPDFRQER